MTGIRFDRVPLALAVLGVALAGCGESPAPDGAPAGTATTAPETAAPDGPDSAALAEVVVDYPLADSIFPPDFVQPTFLWHDDTEGVTAWAVEVTFTDGSEPLHLTVPGDPPPMYPADPEAWGDTNEPYEGTDYQRSARSWTPERAVWEDMKQRSVEKPMTITFSGLVDGAPVSRGGVTVKTSKDPVGAPFFYRDVPLIPSIGEDGRIRPLADKAIPLIAWRLRDVSLPDSKIVLKGMSSCGNCHSFSLDGKTLGMDVDGPTGDKGMYAIKPLSKQTVIDYDDVITWNSFQDKPKDHKTIGFLSRISPDGSTVVSTVNEGLYVNNFPNFRFLQVFYPTEGILAYYDRDADEIRAIPGADDPDYVHSGAVWTPDGKELVFMRAKARPSFGEGMIPPRYPNDPNELEMRYDLYRMPFDDGKGGKAVPVPGASENGMSNTFAKISPDGKWLVWVKCKNGLLLRPDGRLWITAMDGSTEPRRMNCNMDLMNSWHSFSPNSRWMVFTSKNNRPYTQAFLTHIDENGNDSPAILVPNCTASNRAVNLPEFLNAPYDSLDGIDVPAIAHHVHFLAALDDLRAERWDEAMVKLRKSLAAEPTFARALGVTGYVLKKQGKFDESVAYLERAVEIDPSRLPERMNLALAYLDADRPSDAMATYDALLETAPWFAAAEVGKRQADLKTSELEARLSDLLGKSAKTPDDGSLHAQLARIHAGLGHDMESVRHLARAVELSPDDGEFATRLAWVLATSPDDSIRDGARAVEVAKKAVELTGDKDARALDALAAAHAETGHFDEAVAAQERALACAGASWTVLSTRISERLELYRGKAPFRSR